MKTIRELTEERLVSKDGKVYVMGPTVEGTSVAQGDMDIERVGDIPGDSSPLDPEGGRHILAHSETGHHHWVSPERVSVLKDLEDPSICYLMVAEPGADIVHDRSFRTHTTVRLRSGKYKVTRQRERSYTPQGWTRVND